jgi:hypothetical protein
MITAKDNELNKKSLIASRGVGIYLLTTMSTMVLGPTQPCAGVLSVG